MDIFFTEEKLACRIDALAPWRMRDAVKAHGLRMLKCPPEDVNPSPPPMDDGWTEAALGQEWSGRDKYLWLSCDLEFPAQWSGRQLVGLFNFGVTGSCSTYGFEALLYVDGTPFQGVDTHHQEVYFPEHYAGRTVPVVFRLWSGLEGGGVPRTMTHVFRQAETAWLDESVDQLYYTGRMILETLPLLSDNDPVRTALRDALNQALLAVDWRDGGSGAFYASVKTAWDTLNRLLASMDKQSIVDLVCVGHTHIDVAWLWRYKHTREKSARSFSTVLRLMEQYPEYTFLQSQPQLYEYIKNDFPEIYEGIRQKIREGRWEVDGGMWIEADCNIPSGESLTRQILVGTRFTEKEFGTRMHYLWLPDVFGYSWALPQILKKSGLDTFITTKISWNECNQMPHDTFYWVGIDGTKILTHFITTPAASEEQGTWYYTYNGEMVPGAAAGIWNNYRNKDLTSKLLMAYGYGDGGGGVNREELEQRRIIDRLPGLPHIRHGNGARYFKELQDRVDSTTAYFPEWDGELYLENHRGTYTSHAYNKWMNRRLEYLYRDTEWLAAMAACSQGRLSDEEQEALTEGWKIILRNQFHDVIPGSAIREVYEDSFQEYKEAWDIGEKISGNACHILARGGDGLSVINSGNWTYEGLVELPDSPDTAYLGPDGRPCPMQHCKGKTYISCTVPPMSIKALTVVKTATPKEQASAGETPFTFDGHVLSTPYYEMVFNEKGQLTSLYDKDNRRRVLAPGERGNVLQFFEDRPNMCDAWNINLFYQEKMWEAEDLVTMELTENGPLCAVIHMEWKYSKSYIWQDLCVYANERRIDFKTRVDMHETHQLMKAAFPVDIRTTYATYDIQYGNVRRPNNWNTSWDIAKFEMVLHKWVDLSDSGYGVSLMNDSKYGCDVKGNLLRLTLIKTATNPDYLQDQGMHQFTYSLYPHAGDVAHSHTEQAAYYLNNPVRTCAGTIQTGSFLSFSAENIMLDAVKCSEDRKYLVVRFHEFAGAQTRFTITPGFDYAAWTEGSLLEDPTEDFRSAGCLELTIHPFEIKTLMFQLS